MGYKHEFLYPSYYKDFACKCGDCRATCCHGWGITLSRDDYFKVTGTEASPELRRRLDVAFKPASNPPPTPERYAMISYNWQGRCPIQTEDGFCLLHRECGEGAIPEICRRYPRMIRTLPVHECCTSGSCEYTLELLFADDDPLRLERSEIEVFDEEYDLSSAAKMEASEYTEKREAALEIISDRRFAIDERILKIGEYLGAKVAENAVTPERLADFAEKLAEKSQALTEIFEECGEFLGKTEKPMLGGKFDIYMEKLLANHIFYKSFPHSFAASTSEVEVVALMCVKGLTEYFAGGYIAKYGESTEKFVDVTAKLFRMIEHSRFDEMAAKYFLKA